MARSRISPYKKPMIGQKLSGRHRSHLRYRGCVGHWIMGEGGGLTAFDASGYGRHGTLTNMDAAASWVPSSDSRRAGNTLNFDGTDDFVSIPFSVNPANAFSLFAWVRLDTRQPVDVVGGNQCIFQQLGTSGRTLLFRGASSGNGTLDKLTTFLGGGNTASSQTIFATTGAWYHVGLTYDLTTVRLFINGLADGSSAATGESETSGYQIGRHKTPDATREEWAGLIDDVRLYDYAVDPSVAFSLYRNPFLEWEETHFRSIAFNRPVAFRSLLAFWIGGARSSEALPPEAAFHSMLGVWIGGARTPAAPPAVPSGGIYKPIFRGRRKR